MNSVCYQFFSYLHLMMRQVIGYRNGFTILTLLLISGCNGSESSSDINPDDNSQNSSTSVALLAMNSQELTVLGQAKVIDLKPLVKVSDNTDFELTQIERKSGHCTIYQQKQSFTAASEQLDDCILQYTVKSVSSPQAEASALVRLAVNSTYSSPVLPVVTSDAEVNAPISINVREQLMSLGQDVGDSTLSDSIVVIGNGTATKTSTDTITFTAYQKGVSQLYYRYQDEKTLWQGTLIISASDATSNNVPSAQNYIYPQALDLGQQVTVDVQTLGLITDSDNDELQLVDIDGSDSQLTLVDPLDINNTQFTFSSMTPGQHSVLYVVSDHQGGFGSGVILFNVKLDFSMLQPWDDIVIPSNLSPWSVDTTFLAPPSQELLDFNGIDYTSVLVGDGLHAPYNTHVAQLTFEQAREYCVQRGGRLPTQQELELLNSYVTSKTEDTLYSTNNWPVMSDYLSGDFSSENQLKSYSFVNKSTSGLSSDNAATTTCVLLNSDNIKDYSAEGDLQYIQSIQSRLSTVTYDPYGNVAPYYPITIVAMNNKGIFDNNDNMIKLTSDLSGYVETDYYDVSYNDEVLSIDISYLLNTVPYTANLDHTNIDIKKTSEDMWAVRDMKGGFPGLTEQGIPILFYKSGQKVALSYETPFYGENFIASYRLRKSGNNKVGYYSFFIQQISSDPLAWSSIDARGFPTGESVFGFEVDYYYQRFSIIQNGVRTINLNSTTVRQTYSYVWFDKRGDKLSIYTNNTNIIPEKPVGTVDITGLDLNQPYWIGFSGFSNSATNGLVEQLNFTSYTLGED